MSHRIIPVHWKKLQCIFEKAGFTKEREVGSHMSFVKRGVTRPVVIPKYNSIDVEIIKSNMRTAKMSREEYFRIYDLC